MILVKRLQRCQRSKLEDEKNICQRGRLRVLGFEPGWSADIFFDLQLWPLISLQPLDQNQCLVPHLKDLLCICWEIEAQGFWMSFKVCNHGSKYPYFNRAYVVSVKIQSHITVKAWSARFRIPQIRIQKTLISVHSFLKFCKYLS